MKQKIKFAAFCLATLFSLGPFLTYAQTDIEKMNASELAIYWLNKNCDNGEEEMVFKNIKRLATEI